MTPLASTSMAAAKPATQARVRLSRGNAVITGARASPGDASEGQIQQHHAAAGRGPATCGTGYTRALHGAPRAGVAVGVDGLYACVPLAMGQLAQADLRLVHGFVHGDLGEVGLACELHVVVLP